MSESSKRDTEKTEQPAKVDLDGVTEHDGTVIDPQADFFAPPPAEIGALQTAHTTMLGSDRPRSLWVRIALGAGATAIGCGVGLAIDWALSIDSMFWSFLWPAGAALLGLAVGWSAATFTHAVTYVGDSGVAKIACRGSREKVETVHQMAFDDADELRIRTTEHQTNNVYQRTDYRFDWQTAAGAEVLVIAGSYRSEHDEPPTENELHYARSAEKSWTLHLLGEIEHEMEKGSPVRFNLTGGDYLVVGQGYLDIHQKGKTTRCESDDIDDLSLVGGTFVLKRKDAKIGWLRRSGVFEIEYSDLANVGLFLICLERLLGFGL
jgi:hypothetical protein